MAVSSTDKQYGYDVRGRRGQYGAQCSGQQQCVEFAVEVMHAFDIIGRCQHDQEHQAEEEYLEKDSEVIQGEQTVADDPGVSPG